MYDVVTCGSATIDVFAHTDNELIEIRTSSSKESLIAYPSGSKMLIERLQFSVGGGGTNCACGFAKIGMRTGYVGCLGDDSNGKEVITVLKEHGIDFLGHTAKEHTGYSIILDSIEHDRTILTHKGANNQLQFRKIPKKAFSTKWFYFPSMMGTSFLSQQKMAKAARKAGIKIAYNPSEYQVKEGHKKLKGILDATDLLILNREEAAYLTMRAPEADIDILLEGLHGLGIPLVCITDGSRGVYAFDGTTRYEVRPGKVKVVESTGAGDAFSAGFLSWYIKTNDIKESLCAGMTNAESVISICGAKNGLLSEREIKQRMRKSRHVVKAR